MSAYKQKPILEAFKSAGRLANEWRDTLFYTSLLGAGIANQVLEWGLPSFLLTEGPFIRESIRVSAWSNAGRTPCKRHELAALFFQNLSLAAFALTPPTNAAQIGIGLAFFAAGTTMASLGGLTPKGAYKLYEDLLFDYPRKVLPPQDREGHKLKVKAQDFWAGIKEKLKTIAPAPEPKAVLAPVRMAQNATKTAEAHIPA